jgi:hypothetical protein
MRVTVRLFVIASAILASLLGFTPQAWAQG